MSAIHPNTVNGDRVSWAQLLVYGMGGMIPIALYNIAGQLIQLLGNISLGLSAVWLGAILILPRLWDALSDPVVGHLSDNTRSRWGRRRPYILIGGIAVALSFMLMWWVPRGEAVAALFPSESTQRWFQLIYILAGVLIFYTATTVFEIPHGALGMELSQNYHERTRLFSAKSFVGNLFAMGTPWLLYLATRDFISGPGGDEIDGMRVLSVAIAVLLIPMSYWWFLSLREPGFVLAKKQEKATFWENISQAISNRTFLMLVGIVFTLAIGFNFVQIFNYYITIFYLYGGDAGKASELLGVNGTIWAVTGLLAVFPLNWLSPRLGKSRTLLIAILLMCAAQLSKIVCYDPEHPYLIIIPTVLLSSGMLMFFTLGSSMVGDVCDENELFTGSRSEGSFYSVYWWFIKLGWALASFVMGALLMATGFDERQNVVVEGLRTSVAEVEATAEKWQKNDGRSNEWSNALTRDVEEVISKADQVVKHFQSRLAEQPDRSEHLQDLLGTAREFRTDANELLRQVPLLSAAPAELEQRAEALRRQTLMLKQQKAITLFRLRLFEIGVPLALSLVSIALTLVYPLTEERSLEIKHALEQRHAELAAGREY